jgi:hypothetical protein
VNPLQLVELFAVHFGVRTQEVQVRTKRLPLALGGHLLFCELVALTLMDMKDIDLHVFGPARQIRKDCGAFAEVANHVATDVTAEDGARQRILEQDLDHLCSLKSLMAIAESIDRKSTEKARYIPVLVAELIPYDVAVSLFYTRGASTLLALKEMSDTYSQGHALFNPVATNAGANT